jgi:hypothetical protein
VIAEAEAYAAGDYPRILARGHRLTSAERRAAIAKVARLTGLRREYVDRVNLRIEHVRYFTELLRDRGLAVGRLDARFTASEPDGGREHFSADPSYSHIQGPYTAAFNQYVREELGYENDLPYEILSAPTNEAWSYKEFEGRSISVVEQLGGAMRANPTRGSTSRVATTTGPTPLRRRVSPPPADPAELRDNVEFAHYEAGHMMYVHEPSLIRQSADLADFIRLDAGVARPATLSGAASRPGRPLGLAAPVQAGSWAWSWVCSWAWAGREANARSGRRGPVRRAIRDDEEIVVRSTGNPPADLRTSGDPGSRRGGGPVLAPEPGAHLVDRQAEVRGRQLDAVQLGALPARDDVRDERGEARVQGGPGEEPGRQAGRDEDLVHSGPLEVLDVARVVDLGDRPDTGRDGLDRHDGQDRVHVRLVRGLGREDERGGRLLDARPVEIVV